jgi:protocatechuate 3,4-dioxygenase beta subunit
MNHKLVGLFVAVGIVAFAVWFFALRGDKPSSPSQPTSPAGGSAAHTQPPPAAKTQAPAPPGMAPRWELDTDREGPLRLEGQVVDADGQGVGGAAVWLSSVPPRTTTTEDDGSFAFDKLVGRQYALGAAAGTRVGGPVQYRLTQTSDPVVIRVFEGSKLAVTVVTAEGAPIADAQLAIAGVQDVEGKTTADGTATLSPVLPGWAAVQASAAGFAPGSGFTQVAGGGATAQLRITLRKGVAVSGRVIDDRGKPVASARVTTSGVFDLPAGLDPVVTDAKGRFAFAALAAGTHTLVATDGEHAPARSGPLTVEDRPIDNVEIVMQTGGAIAGTVVDQEGAPVAFATIRASGDGQQAWQAGARQVTSDHAGAFELRGLPRAKLKLRAESDAAASAIAVVDLEAQQDQRDLRLVLDVTGTIAGIVVDETGQPLPEVQVNAFPDILGGASADAVVLAGMSSATSDGGGRFVIRGLPDGEYRVRAARSSGRGQYDWGQGGVSAKTGDKDVKITLAAPGSLVGKLVVEGTNAPPGLASVQLGSQPPTAAAKDGSFSLDDLAPGTYDLHVRGPEFTVFTKRDVVIATGKPTDVGTLTLLRGRKLTGRVVDGAGRPVPGAKIKSGDMLYSLQGADEQMETFEEMSGIRSAMSDQDGRFTLIGIAKKSTSLMADHPTRGRSNALEIHAGTDDPPPITLALRGYGSIAGTVTSQGKPVAGASVTATPKGGGAQVQIAQSAHDGSFKLTKIAEGTTVVSVMQQSMMSLKSTSTEVQVTANKQTTVKIDIPVGSVTLSVQIKPLAGQQVDSAQVFMFRSTVAMNNAKDLTDAFLGGGAVGMKFWFGEGKPAPEFDELVAGDYSVCTIPITGDLNDSKFQQRLQENVNVLAVYCKTLKVTASPDKQSFVHEVPAMSPLPQSP